MNNNLSNPCVNFNYLWSKNNIIKIFNLIPSISTKSNDDIYINFINLWEESTKYSGFFKREYYSTKEIKNKVFLKFYRTKILSQENECTKEFDSFDELWKFYDDKKQSIVFYCYEFNKFIPIIKKFFESTKFIKNNKKFIYENQWKFIKYKNNINLFLLNRSKLEYYEPFKWEIFFLPVEDREIQENGLKKLPSIDSDKIYQISLKILLKFIITFFSESEENTNTFVNDLKNNIGDINNKKLEKEIQKKINYLLNNKSENKCIRSIIWLSLVIQNNRENLVSFWAEKNEIKNNKKTIFKWLEEVQQYNNIEIIFNEIKNKKNEMIEFLINNSSNRNTILLPRFICDFKKINIRQKSFVLLDDTLVIAYFDEEWKYNKKYLYELICFYLIDSIRNSRDLISFNFKKVKIWNPRYMESIEISINSLINFYKDNFNFDINNLQTKLRKTLNGE